MFEAAGNIIFVHDHVESAKCHTNSAYEFTGRPTNSINYLFKRTGELRDAAAGQGQIRADSKEENQKNEEKSLMVHCFPHQTAE